jgi:hypothetical protein
MQIVQKLLGNRKYDAETGKLKTVEALSQTSL